MNQNKESFVSCQEVKLSSVRSPADGEEEFPGPVQEVNHAKSDTCKMLFTQAANFSEVKEPADSSVSSGQETPAYCRWAQNLSNLLEDLDGIQLFKTYLDQEHGDSRALNFWFAIKGFRKIFDLPKIAALARTMHTLPEVSHETKQEVSKKMASEVGLDETIFNQAQADIENVMRKTTYPNFLRSDIYIQYMQVHVACHTPDNEVVDSSPDVVASESKSNEQPASKSDSCHNKQSSKGALTSKEPGLKPNSFALDEKESPSNGDLQTVYEDSELEISSRSSHPFRMLRKSCMKSKYSDIAKLKPESQAGLYLKSNTPGYNTYYTKYAGYLPPSAQDSELQSLSSDAQTDDSMSVVSGNLDHDSFYSNRAPKKTQKSRKLHHSLPLNCDTCLPRHTFVPRTDCLPEVPKLSPDKFASLLTEKLLKVQENRRLEEQLNERLQEESRLDPQQKAESSSHQKHLPLFLFGAKSQDTAQAILDNHVSRVFKDSSHVTPSPSPGCLTPSVAQLPDEQPSKPRDAYYSTTHQCSDGNHFPSYAYQNNQFNSCADSARHRKDFENFSGEGAECSDYELLQSAAFLKQQQHLSYQPVEQPYDHSLGRHMKDSRRSKRASSVDGGSSSCFDSGISATDVTSGSSCSQERLTTWLEMKKYSGHAMDADVGHYSRKSPTSRSPVFGQINKKPMTYSNSRTVTLESGTSWPMASTAACSSMVETVYCHGLYNNQAPTQDPNMMMLQDTSTQLMQTKKKLETMCSVKQKMKKSSRRSYSMPAQPITQSSSNTEVTPVAYCYGRVSVPFLSRLPGKNITLKQFKSLLSKKGNFKYFFKKENEDFGVVFEEINDDSEILPLWEGKVFGLIEQMEV